MSKGRRKVISVLFGDIDSFTQLGFMALIIEMYPEYRVKEHNLSYSLQGADKYIEITSDIDAISRCSKGKNATSGYVLISVDNNSPGLQEGMPSWSDRISIIRSKLYKILEDEKPRECPHCIQMRQLSAQDWNIIWAIAAFPTTGSDMALHLGIKGKDFSRIKLSLLKKNRLPGLPALCLWAKKLVSNNRIRQPRSFQTHE